MENIGARSYARNHSERWIKIPNEVRKIFRAHLLETVFSTPAKIYYKYEGVQPGWLAQAERCHSAGVL
ncbi:hypothetical protein VU07_03775 [Desulfobulbus sp. F4]|nr:hypothetical protein [Desulfobulbus sp. F3]MCW5200908.1 hypothetical protein [Desulfobulbus sp. F4]